ncbi:hypothetical protein [Bosea sp. PAMC 26642]|uniref:hypothetical protein n=1 Tax=Bosea sp. (strain PAMC 26642) TaxID=1792307 RepID=UPI0007700909|nr:hypothetical protein [Bosea sp. PAMC 26642]AMJ60172.1 hypothetical protein AXW83_07550 [Bosea sp. PAMC 26642]
MVSLIIAGMSLGASVLQNINYARSIDSVQRNVLRAESLRSCKDIIAVFFEFRLKAEAANIAGGAEGMSAVELKGLAYRFGALGTFLANFQEQPARDRYTTLAWHLNKIADEGPRLPKAAFDALFNEADKQFTAINDDCVKAATGHLL